MLDERLLVLRVKYVCMKLHLRNQNLARPPPCWTFSKWIQTDQMSTLIDHVNQARERTRKPHGNSRWSGRGSEVFSYPGLRKSVLVLLNLTQGSQGINLSALAMIELPILFLDAVNTTREAGSGNAAFAFHNQCQCDFAICSSPGLRSKCKHCYGWVTDDWWCQVMQPDSVCSRQQDSSLLNMHWRTVIVVLRATSVTSQIQQEGLPTTDTCKTLASLYQTSQLVSREVCALARLAWGWLWT